MIHGDEIAAMVAARGGRLVALAGSRRTHRLDDPRYLQRVIPDMAVRDVYVCGPETFAAGVAAAAEALGVAPDAIHRESFEF